MCVRVCHWIWLTTHRGGPKNPTIKARRSRNKPPHRRRPSPPAASLSALQQQLYVHFTTTLLLEWFRVNTLDRGFFCSPPNHFASAASSSDVTACIRTFPNCLVPRIRGPVRMMMLSFRDVSRESTETQKARRVLSPCLLCLCVTQTGITPRAAPPSARCAGRGGPGRGRPEDRRRSSAWRPRGGGTRRATANTRPRR